MANAVVALDVGVLLGLAGLDMLDGDLPLLGPFHQLAADVFRAVVDPNGAWLAAPFDDPVQTTDDPFGGQREIHLDAQPFDETLATGETSIDEKRRAAQPMLTPQAAAGIPPPACRRIASIWASVYLLVFIEKLLVHLGEKIPLMQPPTFGRDYRSRPEM